VAHNTVKNGTFVLVGYGAERVVLACVGNFNDACVVISSINHCAESSWIFSLHITNDARSNTRQIYMCQTAKNYP